VPAPESVDQAPSRGELFQKHSQESAKPNVCFGSEADLMRRVTSVCLAPQSGLRFRFRLGPL